MIKTKASESLLGSSDFDFSTDGPAVDEESDEENLQLKRHDTQSEFGISYVNFLKKIGKCEKNNSKI